MFSLGSCNKFLCKYGVNCFMISTAVESKTFSYDQSEQFDNA